MTTRRLILLAPAAMVFLAFGIYMMRIAYFQGNPVVFLALFFSSSLIILLSASLIVGVIWRICRPGGGSREPEAAPRDTDHLP